jgi:hypothetical protein
MAKLDARKSRSFKSHRYGNGNALGQAGDGNPNYQWRAAEDPVAKNSNQVLFSGTNTNNVCNNPISAEPGRNPHCGGPTP